MPPRRFRFGDFTLSPARRVLFRGDAEVPLIPRYFDLLVLLVERRNEAVSREEIFESVWSDVVVSDGALTQGVRSLRRSLQDEARDPRFIRTVSRHGYRFVGADVVEEDDVPIETAVETRSASTPTPAELGEARRVLDEAAIPATDEEELRLLEAAETALRAGRSEELSNLGKRALVRALLREARWELRDAEEVPLWGKLGGVTAAFFLVRLRIRRALSIVRRRWLGAVAGGATAGLAFGFAGGLVLLLGPGSTANGSVLVALPLVGLAVGAVGSLGVGGGLSAAEALVRSHRAAALVLLGGAGGGLVGGLAHFIGRYTVEGLFGRDLSPAGGGFEGLVVGAAVGAGYALATPTPGGGMATPRGWARTRAALVTGAVAGVASIVLALTGHHLGAMSLDLMAHSFPGSQVSLDPLARILGEPNAGAITRGVISGFEGLGFGFGLTWGLTARPRGGRTSMVE